MCLGSADKEISRNFDISQHLLSYCNCSIELFHRDDFLLSVFTNNTFEHLYSSEPMDLIIYVKPSTTFKDDLLLSVFTNNTFEYLYSSEQMNIIIYVKSSTTI